ncbi:MAG: MBL fold metallo-hydrolase [Desulfobacterales bacterium]|nr:MBL fold metallo-hydrolase [Desulfobacterales bacterium]
MKIKWNGHASFTITADDGTVIVTDPYDPAGFGGVLKYDMVRDRADGALISHDHADHNYVQGLSGSPEVLRGSGRVKDIQVKGLATYHDESDGSERGANTVFVFTVDRIRFCFVGDLGHRLSAEQIRTIAPVDVSLVPVGGTYTLNAEGAVKLVQDVAARVVIPMHFKTGKCNLPISAVDGFLAKMPCVKNLGKSEIELTPDKLPAVGPEVWVMDHAC